MDRVSDKSYTPVAGVKLKHSSEPGSCFSKLRSTKVEAPPTSKQSTHTTTSVFKQANSLLREPNPQLLREPNLQKKPFPSKSAHKSKEDNIKNLEKTKSTQMQSLHLSTPHINKIDQDLQANLKLATRIAGEVSRAVPKSTNALESGRVHYKTPPIMTKTSHISEQVIVPHRPSAIEAFDMQRDSILQWSKTWDDFFRRTEIMCKNSGMGNCQELAAMACKSLKDNGAEHVDYVLATDKCTDGFVLPHSFAVVGRTESGKTSKIPIDDFVNGTISNAGDLGLPNQWNESAVICDPWARNAYPAKDFDQFWDIIKGDSESPSTLTCVLLHRFPET